MMTVLTFQTLFNHWGCLLHQLKSDSGKIPRFLISFYHRGQLHIQGYPMDIGHSSIYGNWLGCTRDEGEDLWNCHWSTQGLPRTGLQMKRLHKGLVLWPFFNSQTHSVSVHSTSVPDPVRSGNVLRIFIGVEASRMKGMPQWHPGWSLGLGTMRTLTGEIQKSYGY